MIYLLNNGTYVSLSTYFKSTYIIYCAYIIHHMGQLIGHLSHLVLQKLNKKLQIEYNNIYFIVS